MNNDYLEHLKKKRVKVLVTIKPVLETFEINDFDYTFDKDTHQETLIIEKTKIGCTLNSIEAIMQEVLGYLFVKKWIPRRSLGSHEDRCIEAITHYWIK